MKRKIIIRILAALALIFVMGFILSLIFVDPWVEKKIKSLVNNKDSHYIVNFKSVHVSILTSTIEIVNIKILTKPEQINVSDYNGAITSIKLKGIKLVKAIFKKELEINEIIITNTRVNGRIKISEEQKPPGVSPINIQIGKIYFEKINLELSKDSTSQTFSIIDGNLKIYDFQLSKKDTLNISIIKRFDLQIPAFHFVSADSMNTTNIKEVRYSGSTNILEIKSLSIHPNYSNYDFTSRNKFQSDRIEAVISNIFVNRFLASGYLQSGSILCSTLKIENMDLHVFRDRRRPFHHISKPMFQEMIYQYDGKINIDSLVVKEGNITYAEHATKATKPGSISFNKINAAIYKISNDTINKTKDDTLIIRINALLMGKGKMTLLLKSKLFDTRNKFLISGTLSKMDIKELNPILENSAFMHVTTGSVNELNYYFIADDNKAIGKLTMLYNKLNIDILNKETGNSTAIKERAISFIANIKLLNQNPLSGEEVRVGIIDNPRDPEKFLFNYLFKSVLSGIKSSIDKSSKEKNK